MDAIQLIHIIPAETRPGFLVVLTRNVLLSWQQLL